MKTILLLICAAWLSFTSILSAQIIYPADNGFAIRSVPSNQIAVGPGDTVGSPWTFSGHSDDAVGNTNQSGIAPNGSQNMDDAPTGQAGFLQDVSSISQTITLSYAATVSISFDWEGRAPVTYDGHTTGQDTITVSFGGIVLFTGTPNTVDNIGKFQFVTTQAADFSAGTYNLVFSGISSGVATNTFTDNMTFIDSAQVNTAAVPEPSACGLIALGGVVLFALFRKLESGKGQNRRIS